MIIHEQNRPDSRFKVYSYLNSRALSGINKLAIDREMFSGSVDAGFVLALPFHHGDLDPDCVEASTRGAYARDENTSARLCPKNAGGA